MPLAPWKKVMQHPVLNIGTTFKGAYDDVEEIGNRLKPILEKYKLYPRRIAYAYVQKGINKKINEKIS